VRMSARYALFGNPVGHSKSPFIYRGFAQATGLDIDYGLIEAPLDGFVAAANAFVASGAKGGNVTAPFKLEAFAWATERAERAALAGATNCLKFEPDGRVIAEMFDGIGLAKDIERNLGVAMAGKRVLLLGAGGAVRGTVAPFLDCSPAALVIANRSADKAIDLAQAFSARGQVSGCGYADLAGERFDVVVNGTSAGQQGVALPLPASVFATATLAYDMSYGKGLTPFLQAARAAGAAQLADGVGMLVEQAAEAWVFWHGIRPDTRATIDRLTVPLIS
jgi:shikimate dehydrogenase